MGPFNFWSMDGSMLGFFCWFNPDLFVPARKQPEGNYAFFEVDGKRVEFQALAPCLDFLQTTYEQQQQKGSNQ